jgi:hypothetical protein
MTALQNEIQYLVLRDATEPFLLARVRWPDIFQAISPARPTWQDDPGLFDLPYSPAGTEIGYDEAARLATKWGAALPGEDEGAVPGPALIRWMPSEWESLSRAEQRAWSLESKRPERAPRPAKAERAKRPKPARAAKPAAAANVLAEPVAAMSSPESRVRELLESRDITLVAVEQV